MRRNRLAFFFLVLLTAGGSMCGVSAGAATPYGVTAANLTMPANESSVTSGGVTSINMGSSQFTVTGVPAEGTLTIGCQYSGPATEAKIPQQCGIVGPGQLPVQAGETTVNGTVYFVPYGETTPSLAELRSVPSSSSRPSRLPASAVALAGALMLGFGFRRKAPRALFLGLLAACALAGAAGISGCGAEKSTAMTPGNYAYTISAGFTETGSSAIQTASTIITLTVQ